MTMKLIDKSEMVNDEKKGRRGARNDKRFEIPSPAVCVTEKTITILAGDKIIRCERRELGTVSNCAICEDITKEMFDRCKHKWTEY